jgi:hypothetical protein
MTASEIVAQSRALCAEVADQLAQLAAKRAAEAVRRERLEADLADLRASVVAIQAAVKAELNGGEGFLITSNGVTMIKRVRGLPDARLIAAAPDLLVACQAVLPALEWCHAQGLQTSGALEIVRAAIAKAKGE